MRRNDPEDEFDPDNRNNWLRKLNRAPLGDRFEEVFGREGRRLLLDLREAVASFEKMKSESFDRYARRILWHCAKIPPEENGMERRLQYLQACINEYRVLDSCDENHPDGEDDGAPDEPSIAELYEQRGIRFETVWELLVRLTYLYQARWPEPDDEDRVDIQVERILRKAASKKHPLKYLRVVIRNEERANRDRKMKKSTK